jgi:uncharacterized protein
MTDLPDIVEIDLTVEPLEGSHPLAAKGAAEDTADHTADLSDEEAGPLRRCVATGRVGPKGDFVRFVVAPDGTLVPDIDAKLPGRGLHLDPTPEAIALAVKKRSFSRAARRPVAVPDDLAATLDRLLVARAVDLLGLARRAGQAVVGYDQVEPWLKQGRAGVLIQASDAAEGGRAKLSRIAHAVLSAGKPVPDFACLTAEELARPFGRDHAVHVAVSPGGLSRRLQVALARLNTLRACAKPSATLSKDTTDAVSPPA